MAELGFRTLEEMIGRPDPRPANVLEHWKAKSLDFSKLLHQADRRRTALRSVRDRAADHGSTTSSTDRLIHDAKARHRQRRAGRAQVQDPQHRPDRRRDAVSGEIAKRYGHDGLPDDTVTSSSTGTAGQSFGAFLRSGITFVLEGDANDYVGKGMTGGKIVVNPPAERGFVRREHHRRQHLLYGATGGTPLPTAAPANASPCATPAPPPSSKASATTAANT